VADDDYSLPEGFQPIEQPDPLQRRDANGHVGNGTTTARPVDQTNWSAMLDNMTGGQAQQQQPQQQQAPAPAPPQPRLSARLKQAPNRETINHPAPIDWDKYEHMPSSENIEDRRGEKLNSALLDASINFTGATPEQWQERLKNLTTHPFTPQPPSSGAPFPAASGGGQEEKTDPKSKGGGWEDQFMKMIGIQPAEAKPAAKPRPPETDEQRANRGVPIGTERDGKVWDGDRWVDKPAQPDAQQAAAAANAKQKKAKFDKAKPLPEGYQERRPPEGHEERPEHGFAPAWTEATKWPTNIRDYFEEGSKQLGEGAETLQTPYNKKPGETVRGRIARGLWDMVAGGFEKVYSPLGGTTKTAGKVSESLTGVPWEWTQFALDTAVMGRPGMLTPGKVAGTAEAAAPSVARGARSIAGRIAPESAGESPSFMHQRAARRMLGEPEPYSPAAAVGKATGANLAERTFSPETTGPAATDAVAGLREHYGEAWRKSAASMKEMEGSYRAISRVPQEERDNLIKWIDGGKGATPPSDELKPAAKLFQNILRERRADLEALPEFSAKEWREEYFPHMWEDPKKGREFAEGFHGGGAKTGSTASLKQRTMPTYQDGLDAGLKPKFAHPIDVLNRYVTSIDKVVAHHRFLNAGQETGTIIKARPETVGASGRGGETVVKAPTEETTSAPLNVWRAQQAEKAALEQQIKDGMDPMSERTAHDRLAALQRWEVQNEVKPYDPREGRLYGYQTLDGSNGQLMAPEGFARIYNNWRSLGFHQWAEGGETYDAVRKMGNASTAFLLAPAGYHAFTMGEASLGTQLSRAMSNIYHLEPMEAFKNLAELPASPVTYNIRGGNWQKLFLDPAMKGASEVDRQIVKDLTKGGWHPTGRAHSPDSEITSSGSYQSSIKKGKLGAEFKAQLELMKNNPLTGTAKTAFNHIGRTLQSISDPLFNQHIPRVKAAAAAERYGDWLRRNLNATEGQRLAKSREIIDSTDNRFGEMVQNHVMMNNLIKQGLMASMLSYSWNVGGLREWGGGIRDIGRSMTGGGWSPKATYVMSSTIVFTMLNSMYQWGKTGKWPWEGDTPLQDMFGARTGGTTQKYKPPGPNAKMFEGGSYEDTPERILMPGYWKDLINWSVHPSDEASNKINNFMRDIWQLGVTQKDYRGLPIFAPRNVVQGPKGEQYMQERTISEAMKNDWIYNAWEYLHKSHSPISLQKILGDDEKPDPRSNISTPERLAGFREALRPVGDPNYRATEDYHENKEWTRKQNTENAKRKRQEALEKKYGGANR
jgi:hypothetical protein